MAISEEVKDLLQGAMDLHVHTSPDIFPRKLDDMEAAEQAKEVGLSGLVLKNHFFPTTDRAALAGEKAGFGLIGSMTLNKPVGGFNPDAVYMAIKAGAKIIWMPTVHSVNTVSRPDVVAMFESIMRQGETGLSLLEDNALIPEIDEILEIIRDQKVSLATGHIYPDEVMALVRAAVDMKLNKIILTHPLSSIVGMTVEQIRALTDLSDHVFVEFTCFDCCQHVRNPMNTEQVVHYIHEIGPEHVLLSSDGGQKDNPFPVDMLADMVENLIPYFNREQIRTMIIKNPSYLVS